MALGGARLTGVDGVRHAPDARMDPWRRSNLADPNLALAEGLEASYREQLMS